MATRNERIGLQSVSRLGPGDTIWDSDLKRFGVRRRTHRITYFVKAQIDRQQKWITIGQHGPMTPAEARAAARTILGMINSWSGSDQRPRCSPVDPNSWDIGRSMASRARRNQEEAIDRAGVQAHRKFAITPRIGQHPCRPDQQG